MSLADSGRARPRAPIGPEPVTEFMGDHDRLSRSLLKVLQNERESHAAALAKGGPKDFAEYRNRVGVIEGLDIAIGHCQEVQRQL